MPEGETLTRVKQWPHLLPGLVAVVVLFLFGLLLVLVGGEAPLAIGSALLTGAALGAVAVLWENSLENARVRDQDEREKQRLAEQAELEERRIRSQYQMTLGLEPSLAGRSLAGLDLRRIRLPGRNMHKVNLSMATLDRADLRGANLQFAVLKGAYAEWAEFDGAVLRGADLTGAFLINASFVGADFRGANLDEADLGGADLAGADLAGATNLRFADLGLAEYDDRTRWPDGFTPPDSAVKVDSAEAPDDHDQGDHQHVDGEHGQ